MDAALLRALQEALLLALLLAAPPVLAAAAISLLVALLQTSTQVQEPTLPVAPRLLAGGAALLLAGPWIAEQLVAFAAACFALLPHLAR